MEPAPRPDRGEVPVRPVPPPPVADLDWSPAQARQLGEGALDLWEELLGRLRELPVSRADGRAAVQARVLRDVPEEPLPAETILGQLRELILGAATYPGHPRYMAYITGAGTVPAAAAALLAAAANQNVGAWRLSPGGTEVELHLVRWLASQLGLPEGAGGLLTSGGAMASFLALKVARDSRCGWEVRRDGVAAGPPLVLYASEEVHGIVDRAADMLGLGAGAVRRIAVDQAFRMRLDRLEAAIAADRGAGMQPLAVVATAGTVNTGAVDPLPGIAELCARQGLWLHVDGAYGAAAALAPELRPLLAGIERADSVAMDAHKWLYVPVTAGCVLLRDAALLRTAFSVPATYQYEDPTLVDRGPDLRFMGAQFSRSFDALKVWVSLLAHGTRAYGRRIAHDAALARHLAALADASDCFEVTAPVSLSIACFRYVPPDLPRAEGREDYLDRLNARLMTAIQLDGRAYCSNAVLRGRFSLRACIVNYRTEAEDVAALLDVAAELGAQLDRELRPDALRVR
jgi:glutamate/tyrosine decarboxylase-like PLP-dependent enzyme